MRARVPRSRVTVIVAAVVIPLAIVAAALAFRSDESDKARLPVTLSSPTTTAAAAADIARYPYTSVRYEAGADLPSLGDDAPAYKLDGSATAADMDRLQKAFGMNGGVVAEEYGLNAVDGDRQLWLEDQGALGWSYSSSNGVVSSGVATACSSDAPDCVPETTIPERPADLPAADEAKARALELLRGLGTDVDHATVAVDDAITSWNVRVDPVLDGVKVENLTSTATVGPGGTIEYATGYLATPTKVDSYPLVTTAVAIDRLNQGIGLPGPVPLEAHATDLSDTSSADESITTGTPRTTVTAPASTGASGSGEPGSTGGGGETPAAPPIEEPPLPTVTIEPSPPDFPVPSEPQVVVLTGADTVVVRTFGLDGRSVWLLPAYHFSADSSDGPTVLAVVDKYMSPTPDGTESTGSTGSKEPSSGSVEPQPAPAPIN